MNKKLMALVLGGVSALAGLAGQELSSPQSDPFELGLILKSAREYCRRLEQAALDFVCLEEVTEKVDISRDSKEPPVQKAPDVANPTRGVSGSGYMSSGRPISFNPGSSDKREHTFVFDYQFIRREGKVEEKRVLLEKDGKKATENTPLPPTRAFNFSDILLAPVRLLDERLQGFYVYRLTGHETLDGVECRVLEVAPRFSTISSCLGGKIWLKADDASVLRIEWDPSTFGNYETVRARAKGYKATPEVRSYSEFGVEKNGLRFPSIDFTEEAYRGAGGKLFVRAKTSVVYRNHKFFTVETQTIVK
jgi:hypothetical protein